MLSRIYFYTTRRFGWGSSENFQLAAVLGVIYVLGALSAHGVVSPWGGGRRWYSLPRHGRLRAPAVAARRGCSCVLFFTAAYLPSPGRRWRAWCVRPPPGRLARRLGVYNCVWSGSGAVTSPGGRVLKYWQPGIFIVPMVVHAATAVLIGRAHGRARPRRDATQAPPTGRPAVVVQQSAHARRAGAAAPRTLALWMSRLRPAGDVRRRQQPAGGDADASADPPARPTAGTPPASVWMVARWLGFLALGTTSWWHTRPRALLWAAILLLLAFLAITFRADGSPARPIRNRALGRMAHAWQVLLGLALGLIYSASLYFGMVLSDGSTEHGGYHEALIGLGTVIGPGAGHWPKGGRRVPLWGVVAVAGSWPQRGCMRAALVARPRRRGATFALTKRPAGLTSRRCGSKRRACRRRRKEPPMNHTRPAPVRHPPAVPVCVLATLSVLPPAVPTTSKSSARPTSSTPAWSRRSSTTRSSAATSRPSATGSSRRPRNSTSRASARLAQEGECRLDV